ncbi:hypothetical protein ACFFV7_41555 [Nonomuraea spiralis]|uniref:TetR family transcriptional regulator n=1 Tax=Nonomuraea spiralis TaxID=46182 RepID=A0ABV5ITV5_9ACTN|nr:hypothetical protein [Nonomuraea spiralis]GGT16604.1 hypothetical protein GCM10010176_071400 [Nonomuraea spiralis]
MGISHPNLFRLFSTKKELFLAVLVRLFETIDREMVRRGSNAGADPVPVMVDAWGVLMEDRALMLMMLQGYAACDDRDVRDLVARSTQDIFENVELMPGVGADRAHAFVAEGMRYMVSAAMDLPRLAA